MAIKHPASGYSKNRLGQTGYPAVDTPAEKFHGFIVNAAKSFAVSDLADAGHDVPEDRIAVVLL